MNPTELRKLIASGENLRLDFKRELSRDTLQDLPKDIAAFANTEGGQILIGVTNDKVVVGAQWNPESTSNVIQQGLHCTPPVQVVVSEVQVSKGKKVAVIEIQKSSWIHMDNHQRFPFRAGDVTQFMDASMIWGQAQLRGWGGSGVNQPPTQYERRKPGPDEEFIAGYLSHPDPALRTNALTDLGNVANWIVIEDIPDILAKLSLALKDQEPRVREAAINAVDRLYSCSEKKGRKEYPRQFGPSLSDMTLHDADLSIRKRALTEMCALGGPGSVDTVLKIILGETNDAYLGMNVPANLRLLIDRGLGVELRERIYACYSEAHDDSIRDRLQEALSNIRNFYWPR